MKNDVRAILIDDAFLAGLPPELRELLQAWHVRRCETLGLGELTLISPGGGRQTLLPAAEGAAAPRRTLYLRTAYPYIPPRALRALLDGAAEAVASDADGNIAARIGDAGAFEADTFENTGKIFDIPARTVASGAFCRTVTTPAALDAFARFTRRKTRRMLLDSGVFFADGGQSMISPAARIAPGTVILANCTVLGRSFVEKGAVIGPDAWLENAHIGPGSHFRASFATDSVVGADCAIGPFVQLRPGCRIGDRAKLGNFVEVKNSTVGEETSVSHLTYVGDSDVGSRVNFGCGVVTVNYDGRKKHRTRIGDGAFVGCNSNLIAPVTVGDGAYIAAGSTITHDVPPWALAIARERQSVKENWALGKYAKAKPREG